MTAIPKRVHLVGVGGAHMSAIARILVARGHEVTGSDMKRSAVTAQLEALGVAVREGHAAENVGDAGLVVTTSAAKADNPELAEARRRGIPVIKRAEMVTRLMEGKTSVCVAGTHGKTTTTGLVAFMLTRAGLAPTYLVGGDVRDLGANAAEGEGPHVVVEADEYDSAFLSYRPDVAIVTNVEADHLEYFGTFERLAGEFAQFMAAVSPEGYLIACMDSPKLAEIVNAGGAVGRAIRAARVETYALHARAKWLATDLRPNAHGGLDFVVRSEGETVGPFSTRIPGEHNVSNALAVIIAGLRLGLSVEAVRDAVAAYRGVQRRFELVGEARGVTVVDDFAHHPTEIKATVAAARVRYPGRRIVAIFQPHTYTRTQYLLDDFKTCFGEVDRLFILETYAAREDPVQGLSGKDLADAISEPKPAYAATFEAAAEQLASELRTGDVLLTIGAGDVDQVGPMTLARLKAAGGRRRGSRGYEKLAAALERQGIETRRNEPLSRHTTFGIGGPADMFAVARSSDELRRIIVTAREYGASHFVLGSGSNILVGDGGIRGVTIANEARREGELDDLGDGRCVVTVESGASFASLARNLARRGYAGLEWACGIPGTIGGAVVYNAGAYGGCLADALLAVTIVNGTNTAHAVPAEDLDLAYRGSVFTRGIFRDRVVLDATVVIWRSDAAELQRRIAALDEKRLAAQPRGRNAGSIFKNAPDRPAWRLIDAAGLRGHRIGDAQISDRHCNFIVNLGSARAADVKALMDLAQARVREESGVELEPEITLVGEGFDD